MSYRVKLRDAPSDGKFPRPATVQRSIEDFPGAKWALNANFPELEYAIDAAQQWLRLHPGDHVDVEEDGKKIVWCSIDDWKGQPYWVGQPTSERTVVQTTDLDKPLNIGREALVARLQENLDEEKKERETVEAKERAARTTVQQFVEDHEDELIQWIGAGAPGGFGSGGWEDIAKNMARFFEDNDYKPKSARKSKRENDLEKFVRVLNMATDTTVEVKPNQPIYDLL